MWVTCLQENFSRGLATVGRAVASRATLPVTQNVLLQADGNRLKITATNLGNCDQHVDWSTDRRGRRGDDSGENAR